VRADLRTHVARGGELSASLVDVIVDDLDRIARELTRTLAD
jgi:hypothetical protein